MLVLVLSCVAAYVFAPGVGVSAPDLQEGKIQQHDLSWGKEERLQQIDNIVHSYDMGDTGRLRAIHTALCPSLGLQRETHEGERAIA